MKPPAANIPRYNLFKPSYAIFHSLYTGYFTHIYIMFIIGDFLSLNRLRTRYFILKEFMNWVEYTQEVYELGRIHTRSS